MSIFTVIIEEPIAPGSHFDVEMSDDITDEELRLVRAVVDKMLE
jgi:hypothetical protein